MNDNEMVFVEFEQDELAHLISLAETVGATMSINKVVQDIQSTADDKPVVVTASTSGDRASLIIIGVAVFVGGMWSILSGVAI